MIEIKDNNGKLVAQGGINLDGAEFSILTNITYTVSMKCAMGCYDSYLFEVYGGGKLWISKELTSKKCISFKAKSGDVGLYISPIVNG